MGRRAFALLLLAAAAGRAAPGDDAVAAAVAKGVGWLKAEQEPHGAYGGGPGETALALMALRHAGVPKADPACAKAARYLEKALPDGTVYGAALGILALLAQSPEAHAASVRKLVKELVGGQCRNGQWTYAYRATARKKAGDNSNTQIAILALAAARTRRFDVPDEAFARCAAYFRGSQNEDGGYGYSAKQRSRSYASMTAGGAMALALCAAAETGAEFGDPALARRLRIRLALAWLGRDFDPAANRGAGLAFGGKKRRSDAFWRHYWLWSLERACAAAGADTVGRHDWYAAGARWLLETQRDDGEWRDPEDALRGTCFALLFLTRATRPVLTPRDKDRPATTPRAPRAPDR